MTVDQHEARKTARALSDAGIQAIADSRGGWSGGTASQAWGVKPYPSDGLSGNYETREQMPQWWREVLEATDRLDAAAAEQQRHAARHVASPARAACDTCSELSGLVDREAARYREVIER